MEINLIDVIEAPSEMIGRTTISLPTGEIVTIRDIFELGADAGKVLDILPIGKEGSTSADMVTGLARSKELLKILMTPVDYKKLEEALKSVEGSEGVYASLISKWISSDDKDEDNQVGEASA